MENYNKLSWYEKSQLLKIAFADNDFMTKEAGIIDKAVLWGALLTMGVGGLSEAEAANITNVKPLQITEIMQNKKMKDYLKKAWIKNLNKVEQIKEKYKGMTKNKENTYTRDIIARTIYSEAEGQPIAEKRAVASIIYNRSNGNVKDFINTIVRPYQFSEWNVGTPKQGKGSAWTDCLAIADEMVSGTFKPIHKYKHFFNPKLAQPKWGIQNGKLPADHIRYDNDGNVFLTPFKKA